MSFAKFGLFTQFSMQFQLVCKNAVVDICTYIFKIIIPLFKQAMPCGKCTARG